MPETNTQTTTDSQSSNADSSKHPASTSSTSSRPRLRWPLAVLLIAVVTAGILKLYTDQEVARLEQEQQQSQQELQRQASIQELLVGTLSADRIEADESDLETLKVNGRATIDDLMVRTAEIEDLQAGDLAAEEGELDTLLVRGARITDGFRVSGDTTLADLLLKGQLRLTGNTEDMVLFEPGDNGQPVFSVRIPSGEETARLNARGDLYLAGDTDIGGVLRVSRNAAFNADVLVKGGLVVQKSVQFQDSLRVEQNATFKSDVRMEQNQEVQGQLTAGTTVSTGTTELQGAIFNTSSNNQGRVYVDDDFEVTGTMYGADLVLSGSVTQGDTTINNLTVLGTADFLGPVTMSDELTVSTDIFYADSVNSRVGIGTDTPSQLLHVAGNALVDNDLTVSGSASIANNLDAGGNLTVSGSGAFTSTVSGANASANDEFVTLGQINDGGDTSTSVFVQGGNSFGTLATLGTNDANALAIETGGTERLRVDTSGNVGIGFTTPNVPLEVSDTLRVSKSNDQNRGLNIHLGFSGRVYFTSRGVSGNGFSFRYNNYDILGLGNGGNHDNAIFGNSTNVFLSPTGTATDTTQYPSNNLVLQGSAWDSTNSTAENRTVSLKTITGSGTDGNEPYRLAVINNAGNEFVTFDGANSRVGIGTASPGNRLDLGDSAGDISIYDGNGTEHIIGDQASGETDGIVLRPTSNPIAGEPIFVVESGGFSQRLRVEHAGYTSTSNELAVEGTGNSYIQGNLGIGTSTPSSNLQIANNVANGALDNFSEYQLLLFQSGDNVAASSYGLGVRNHTLAFNTDRDFDFDQDGSTVMTINSGNVGIGTTSPSQKLTLQDGNFLNAANSANLADGGSLNSGDLTLQGYYDSDGTTAINPAARTMNLRTIVDTSGNEHLAVLNDAGNEFVTFDGSNRRVGIGTTTPEGIFMVNGYQGGTYGFTMQHKGSATTFRGASSATEGSYFHIEHRGSNETTISGSELYIDNVDRITGRGGLGLATALGGHHAINMIIDGGSSLYLDGSNNSRFVGIGTTSPGARLQVNTNGGGRVGQIIKGADSQSADLLQARDSTGTVLASIDASGNLTVKNATVNGTLTVNGVAVVDGVQTSIATKTADYTLTDSDSAILADASGGAVTITLPSAVGREGRKYTVKKIDGSANNVVLATDGTETIDGASSKTISSENHFVKVVSNGSDWYIISIAPSL